VQCWENQILINGEDLEDRAKICSSSKMNISDFIAGNGWLCNFKKRHDISFQTICGKSVFVDIETCDKWKSNLPSLVQDYQPEDIFNTDESCLFFKCLPSKTLALKSDPCQDGKCSKE